MRTITTITTNNVLKEVLNERIRQDEKWGEQNHRPAEYLMILGEEVGEVNKAALESHFSGKPLSDYRDELVQVAAVAVAMIECFDRNNPPTAMSAEEIIKKCDSNPFEHNKSIFHLGQCQYCYRSNVINSETESYAQEVADRQSVELLEWVRVILIEFPNSRWTICIDDVEKLTSPELLAKFHENRKKA